jgi:hypothetical protein
LEQQTQTTKLKSTINKTTPTNHQKTTNKQLTTNNKCISKYNDQKNATTNNQ